VPLISSREVVDNRRAFDSKVGTPVAMYERIQEEERIKDEH